MDLAIPFAAQTINVDPSPDLTLRYFEQEFVYGPDPTNPSAPSEPFALGVQVVNTGAGTANDVSITSAQPEIVDNEKGLLINFQVIATQVDGQSLSPSLTANFGDIDPGDVGTGVFLMTSSLQGQFIDYSASFEDESGLGTPQLAIISSIEIHQLLHLASEVGPGASTGTAFLVDDNPGADTNPTAIYLPDGSTAPVSEATDVETEGTLGNGDLQIQLTYTTTSGWNYLSIPDPGNGQYELVSVTRSDGVTLPANDYWQTDRTFIGGGRPPIYENMLQILDDNGTGTYTLTYVPINQTHPAVTSISSVSPNPTTTPVGSLQVTFNEPIALGTFNFDDLSLTLNNGPNLIASTSGVTVSLVSGSTYQISGLGALDAQPGVYSLTVNASGIEDSSGNVGTGSDSTSWVEAAGEPAVLTITGVTPGLWNTPVRLGLGHLHPADRHRQLRPLGPQSHRGRRLEPHHEQFGRLDHPGRARHLPGHRPLVAHNQRRRLRLDRRCQPGHLERHPGRRLRQRRLDDGHHAAPGRDLREHHKPAKHPAWLG